MGWETRSSWRHSGQTYLEDKKKGNSKITIQTVCCNYPQHFTDSLSGLHLTYHTSVSNISAALCWTHFHFGLNTLAEPWDCLQLRWSSDPSLFSIHCTAVNVLSTYSTNMKCYKFKDKGDFFIFSIYNLIFFLIQTDTPSASWIIQQTVH